MKNMGKDNLIYKGPTINEGVKAVFEALFEDEFKQKRENNKNKLKEKLTDVVIESDKK